MSDITHLMTIGSSIVFRVRTRALVYKVDIGEIASGGDFRLASCYSPSQGWAPCMLKRALDAPLMDEVERQARLQEPVMFARWAHMLQPDAQAFHEGNNHGY